MRIGFIGLGRMGANMVRRLLRDGHEVVAYNRTVEKTPRDRRRGRDAGVQPSRSSSAKLEKPRAVWIMVPAGDATEAQIEELMEHLEPGDTIVDGGNTNFHDDVRRHAELAAKGHPLRRRRRVRRDLGPGQRLLPDGRRRARGGRPARADLPLARAGGRLPPRRRAGRGPLREDGPQRDRVRPDAGLRRGLRDHARERVPARPRGDREAVEPRLGRALVAARAGRARVHGTARTSTHLKGWVADSGEGRWTVQEAIDRDVPAPVITLSLLTRFRSRQEDSYGAKVLAALRNEFGGHAVKTE